MALQQQSSNIKPSSKQQAPYYTKTFHDKVIDIVSDNLNHESIEWIEDGKVFAIKDRKKLQTDVLSKYFPGVKYSSFIRRLKRWGFKCHTSNLEVAVYFVPCAVTSSPIDRVNKSNNMFRTQEETRVMPMNMNEALFPNQEAINRSDNTINRLMKKLLTNNRAEPSTISMLNDILQNRNTLSTHELTHEGVHDETAERYALYQNVLNKRSLHKTILHEACLGLISAQENHISLSSVLR